MKRIAQDTGTMKKIAALLLTFALSGSLLAGCAAPSKSEEPAAEEQTTEQSEATTEEETEENGTQTAESTTTSSSEAVTEGEQSEQAPAVEEGKISIKMTATGKSKGKSVNFSADLVLDKGATVFNALEESGAKFEVEDSSYGPYVVSIEGLAAEGSSGWVYTANGEEVTVAANKAVLSDGDQIDWKYVSYE